MIFEDASEQFKILLEYNFDSEFLNWFYSKIEKIKVTPSKKDLYLGYTLIASKIESNPADLKPIEDSELKSYLETQKITTLEVARIYFLIKAIQSNSDFYTPLVATIIQIADKSELETFLKYLLVLPHPQKFKKVAVEALRTNITPVFDALAYHNFYPSLFFSEDEWNQLFLKAAFMQRDLSYIVEIDKMANQKLAKIISDYAHERWRASRTVDPYFWRPVSDFINADILNDIKNLFESDDPIENKVATLCCYSSKNPEAQQLLKANPTWISAIEDKTLTWKTLN